MGWSIGFDDRWERHVGHGVPAVCDHPDCNKAINRGLSHVCGGDVFGGEHGCGLFFCGDHLWHVDGHPACDRCEGQVEPFDPKPDTLEWLQHILFDPTWASYRESQTLHVMKALQQLADHLKLNWPPSLATVLHGLDRAGVPCGLKRNDEGGWNVWIGNEPGPAGHIGFVADIRGVAGWFSDRNPASAQEEPI